jgi:addiction module HigA family antidote
MAEYPARRDPNREPTHPGTLLNGVVLPATGESVMSAAKKLGVSRQLLHRILAAQAPITPEMALRLGKFCGNGPNLWLGMQQAYDLWHAEKAMKKTIAKIETAKERAA